MDLRKCFILLLITPLLLGFLNACSDDDSGEPDVPAINSFRVCDTDFGVHMGCDSHHSFISKTSSHITAAASVDHVAASNSYKFTIKYDVNGSFTEIADSGDILISTALNGSELNEEGQVLGFTWIGQADTDWPSGSYQMDFELDSDPMLTQTVSYIIE